MKTINYNLHLNQNKPFLHNIFFDTVNSEIKVLTKIILKLNIKTNNTFQLFTTII